MSKLAKIDYYVDHDKKIVTGRANRVLCHGLWDELYMRLPKSLRGFVTMNDLGIRDIMDFKHSSYKAKAVARDTDEFDEKIGKSIVAKKLNYKYHRSMMKRYQELIGKLKAILAVVNVLEQEHHMEMLKCDEELKKYE